MFSTFRNTVEALAQGTERPKTPDQNGSQGRRSNDLFASPSLLAESALSKLKGQLASSHSPPPRPSSAQSNRGGARTASLSLEDRLRASFTVGEASRATTPGTPGHAGRGDVDPLSVALPMSPGSDGNADSERAVSPPIPATAPVPPAISTALPPQVADEPPLTASFVTVRSLVNADDHPLSPLPPSSPVPPISPRPSHAAVHQQLPGPEPTSGSAPAPDEVAVALEAAVAQASDETPAPALDVTDATPTGVVPPAGDEPAHDHSAEPQTPADADITTDFSPAVAADSSTSSQPTAETTVEVASADTSTPQEQSPEESDAGDVASVEPSATIPKDAEVDVEKLQARLKLVEQRFTDVSTSFKRLQAEKRAADALLKELTPLESISDADGLRDHLRNLSLKLEMSMEEIKRLNAQHQTQELRMEELRDTHRLESASQVELVDQLRAQLDETSAKLAAASSAAALETSSQKAAVTQLTAELDKAKNLAKEEEEKRTKAISLLKTVRTKLVKAEKDREEKEKEAVREKDERERMVAEMKRLETDVERGRSEREREVRALREQFEKEVANVRERFEREAAARKGQFELDAITTKATHNQELAAKSSQIATLEKSVRTLAAEKTNLFDQLQQRQGELESAQSHLETVQSQTGELQYQLREANDRVALLQEELSSRPTSGGGGGSVPSEDVARFLREAEGKYEARLSDLRDRMRALERERNDAEEEWSRNLAERSREVERLRRLAGEKDGEYDESVRGMREREKKIAELEAVNAALRQETEAVRAEVARLHESLAARTEVESSLRHDVADMQSRIDSMAEQADDLRSKESQMRATNKTLRDELRKVQQSAALLERQRNPGVGYWSGKGQPNGNGGESPVAQRASESSEVISPPGSPRPSSPAVSQRSEEDVNLEYLRNVILQFLEHKEMRPNLVRVLSTILRFTPQETRRLIAKV